MAPSPFPLDSGGGGNATLEGAGSGVSGQMGSISLGMLIQYINQRTYSDLLNLAEILPRKSDMEKKIDIVQYAQRTRQLYVRLLALVKWAASASKVDKCCLITSFLEKQNNLFVNTADKLFHMTRENLVHARLPHFNLPAAVETLTTGSYDRLPLTIRQKILPPEPITANERKQVLTKLEQIVQHRLMSLELPSQMRNCKVENGRVRFIVDHEFEVSLTLMGDGDSELWRLLEIHILVEDKETGDGKVLVHPLQIGFIHQLIQSRLQDHENPLHEAYTILHAFCQSLQLEVLYAQTLKLIEDRLDFHIRIEEYLQGRSLTLTYWRELGQQQKDANNQLGYRFTVQVDTCNDNRPLLVMHTPSLGSKECEIAERAIKSDHLSIERLLVHTIYLRTKARLFELKQEFDLKLGSIAEKCGISGSPAVLNVPILQPCLRSEQLLITVDTHTGILIPHIPQYDNQCPHMNELQTCLNGDKSKLDDLISELRYWLVIKRTDKTLQHLAASAHGRLPLMYEPSHPLYTLKKHKVYITFHRHPNYVLIIELGETTGNGCEVEQNLYLLEVKEASIEDDPKDPSVQPSVPKSYLRAFRLIPLDAFLCTHGPATKIDTMEPGERALGGKRKMQQKAEIPPSKRLITPSYFLPNVAQVVAMCDQIFPLAYINQEFQTLGIHTSGVEVEDSGVGVVLRLADMLPVKGLSKSTILALEKDLLAATLRITVQQFRGTKSLVMEYVFTNCSILSQQPKEQGPRRPIYFTYEVPISDCASSTVQSILSDWAALVNLYEIILVFSEYYTSNESVTSSTKNLGEMVRVHSYSYKCITLTYGPNYSAYVTVKYNPDKKAFNLSFGVIGNGTLATNASTLMTSKFEEILNSQGELGLVSLSTVLHHTYQPLVALSKLHSVLHPGINDIKRHHPIHIFTILPRSSTRVHVAYRNIYCLEVDFLPSGLVSVRDGAFSCFENSRIISEFIPIQGLKAFLSKYIDENAISRRRSQCEDDNPPTPVPQDDSPWPTPKPSSPARHGPMTPPVSSNPHTPASPHPGGVSQGSHSFSASPASSAFPLASPPSLPSMNPSPAGIISHPSPGAGGFIGANSPSAPIHNVASPSLLTVPSPVGGCHNLPTHSPASTFLQGSGGSVPQISRMLPNKTYAAAIPTLLTHDAFFTLCSPTLIEDNKLPNNRCTVLEQFLGSTYIKRILQSLRKSENNVPSNDPGTIQFKTESLIVMVSMQTTPSHHLSIKLQPSPDYSDRWTQEELQVLEKFFLVKVSCPPYKMVGMSFFHSILTFPFKILKDAVRLMHMELMLTPQQQQQLKWRVQWCLSVPPISPLQIPVGHVGLIISRNKILFFLQLTRINVPIAENTEPTSIVLPVVHDLNTNKTQMAKKSDNNIPDSMVNLMHSINDIMNRVPVSPQESAIYPCIQELLMNLVIAPDGTAYSGTMTSSSVLATQQSTAISSTTGRVTPTLASPHLSSTNIVTSHQTSAASASMNVTATGNTSQSTIYSNQSVMQQSMMGMNTIGQMQQQQQPITTMTGGIMHAGPRGMQSAGQNISGGSAGMHGIAMQQGMQGQMQNQNAMQGNFSGNMMNQFNR